MCVAVPGKVIEIKGTTGKVDFGGNTIDVNLGLVDAVPGDYVLVHAGCALEVIDEDKASELIKLFEELQEVLNE
ncbi:MAG TPA: HypC/HybG/HupF family hydrogenase formation chaperone [Negativicutes bacterium]|nr:HypC/HybG/HupF family hydrogenase formation chaperone [Negativicutes bacterium]